MDINATIIGQMITFALFVLFTMKFVWPPLMRAMEDRRKKIADGLAAAEQGQKDLEHAKAKAKELINEAKSDAARIMEQAHSRGVLMIEDAKKQARVEGERILEMNQGEIDRIYSMAKEQLMRQVSNIAINGAERILQREIDKTTNDRLVEKMLSEI
jgi:F-type H+-transporting ATPase subunit b